MGPLMNDEDRTAMEFAQAIKAMTANWAHRLELIGLEARIAKTRYDALCKAGFDAGYALVLCTRKVEL